MTTINPVDILSYGVIGLGFLLALLSYRLLTKEQKKEKPRGSILKAINIYMVFSILLCGIGIISEFYKGTNRTQENNQNDSKTTLRLISARPGNTSIGTSEASQKEIKNLLSKSVIQKISELCFSEEIEKDLYGKVHFLIYKTSGGFANNFSIDETNIDESYHSCIRDILRGTKFPEPTDPSDTLVNSNGIKYADDSGVSYWVTAKLELKK